MSFTTSLLNNQWDTPYLPKPKILAQTGTEDFLWNYQGIKELTKDAIRLSDKEESQCEVCIVFKAPTENRIRNHKQIGCNMLGSRRRYQEANE